MVGHGGSSAGSYLADPTSPIPSHCASIVATSTLRVNMFVEQSDKWSNPVLNYYLQVQVQMPVKKLCLFESFPNHQQTTLDAASGD